MPYKASNQTVICHFVKHKVLFEFRFCCEYGCNRDVILFFLIMKLVYVSFAYINISLSVHICKWVEDLKRLDKPVVTGEVPIVVGNRKHSRL